MHNLIHGQNGGRKMSKYFKLLLVILLVLSLLAFFAGCDGGEEASTELEDATQQEDEVSEPFADGDLVAINIYLHGIKTELSIHENSAQLLADALKDELTSIANEDNMINDGSAQSANELMAGYTCLELVYDQSVTLPLTQDEEALSAKRILYAIYAEDSRANILYIGEEIYQGRSLGAIMNSLFAETINDYVKTNVQKSTFVNNQVTVAGVTTDYLLEQSDQIPEPMLSLLLYNAVAFYQNSYNKAFAGNQLLMTDKLSSAIDMLALGAQTDNSSGEQLIFYMDNYFDYSAPSALQAVYEGHYGDYIVYLSINAYTMLEIIFIEQNGYPLVDACRLMSV